MSAGNGGEKGSDLARRLAAAAAPAIERAVAEKAAETAAMLAAALPGGSAVTAGRGTAARVTLSGPGLFAREFGTRDAAADPVMAPALGRLKRRRT